MEILQSNILALISEKCSSRWELNLFKDHILIHLPDTEQDFRSAYAKVKQEITACVKKYFPDRDEDVLFEVRNGAWNCSFKLGKTMMLLKTEGPLSEKDEQYKAIIRAKRLEEEAQKKWEQLKKKE